MAKRRQIAATIPRDTAYHQQRMRQRQKLAAWWIVLGILGLAVVAGAVLLLLRPAPALPAEVTALEAFQKHQAGAFFLDVRTESEWNQGHISGSVLIPLDELPARLNDLPRDRDIVVVCRSGARSQQAADILRQAGFARVTSLGGGLQGWVAAGYPLAD